MSHASVVSAVWNPARETVQVHAIRIIRGDQVIDALDGQTFEVLRRESNLEQSMLDGTLTASLQPRDLRVGDILETAFTIHDTGGVLAPHRELLTSGASGVTIDRYRLRVSWPEDQPVRTQVTAPWSDLPIRRVGRDRVFEVDVTDLAPDRFPSDLPARFQMLRIAQFSDFQDWRAPSRLMAPLYLRSSTLEETSPLHAEIERIRSAHSTDVERAAAALRLVQDQVRYVALSMGEGGYVPTAADEVWRSRFGDCKGKTVLLMALLRGLGIEAEAAMVSTQMGDGLPERLPLVSWFDHVIVRAEIDGVTYWMDGTGAGDRALADLPAPSFRWALPVREDGADLVAIDQPPATKPNLETTFQVDASAGLDADSPMVVTFAYAGDMAVAVRSQIGAIPRDQLQTLMLSMMDANDSTTTIDGVDTHYDDDANIFRMTLRGKTRLAWINNSGGRLMALEGTALITPTGDERRGLFAAFKDHPYAIAHPFMMRAVTRVTLPEEGRGFRLEGGDQTIEDAAYRLSRTARIVDGVAEAAVTQVSLTHEMSAADMAASRKRAETATATTVRLRAPADYVATAGDRARLDAGDSDVDELVRRANQLRQIGDAAGAAALLDTAIERAPEDGAALKARAMVRLTLRDYAGAAADFDRAAELDPADAAAATGQGRLARIEGRHGEAVVSYSVALRLEPGNFEALAGRAAGYYHLGRLDRALADYRALKSAHPSSSTGLYGELRTLRRLQRTDEARALIDERLDKEPADVVALTALVRLSRDQGRPADALAALDAALLAAPDADGVLTLRAESRQHAGDSEGAREDYDVLRRWAAGDPALLNNICWSMGVLGFDLERALADCEAAAEAGQAAFIDSRGMALLQLDRFEEARAAYEEALALAPYQSASLYGRGLARRALGDEAGVEDTRRALAIDIDTEEKFEAFLARRPDIRP
ncbi:MULTISPECIES: DUF3857 domain-containing protein [unclassified Brevundimonas]|uniref:DUF3857 domain-containing protein n=1 Tax=unclassified Brevundimonas TaxID=2622653 RepID=UPI002110731D|nr:MULTISPECIES: DUF3857 domain-containing protein [unclassified Brevundimonas]